MDADLATRALAALAQPTRLDVFKLLTRAEPDGVAAGEIARALGVPHNTLSSHLTIMVQAGLARSKRQSRSIVYTAELVRLREIILYLLKDCCAGKPELCAPLIADLVPCCEGQSGGCHA
jgi:ArsR family transcriptional regulator, arsenate/arsenite/antimonite-responsive transcriptional repressor